MIPNIGIRLTAHDADETAYRVVHINQMQAPREIDACMTDDLVR
jgi:hypothetical protein